MRKITIWILSTVAVLVLLFSYRTSTVGHHDDSAQVADGSRVTEPGNTAGAEPTAAAGGDGDSGSSGTGSGADSGSSDTGSGADSGAGATTAPSSAAQSGTRTVQGSVVQTRHGNVQVRIVVSGRKFTDVQTVQIPAGNHHDTSINAYAVPILRQQAIQTQSADLDIVSGATITSEAYRESLQAAIDKANL